MAQTLPRSTPCAEGVDASAISRYIDTVQAQKGMELHGMMVLRHGKVIAEGSWKPYLPEHSSMLFSLSKSFTSTAVGFAVSEGLVKLDDLIIGLFRDEAPLGLDGYWKELTVHHLLSMNTGQEVEVSTLMRKRADGQWMKEFFNVPITKKPGTWFLYNTGASYMLSALVQKVTGQRLLEYLKPRLLEPLGIKGAEWEQSPEGIDYGGFGLLIKLEDIALFGQFLLQRGYWEGRQILPASWVDRATAVHSDNRTTQINPDFTAGYGYQFWHCVPGCYRGDGAFGQYCIVMPELDTVIAITSGVTDMQAILTYLWNILLPGVGKAKPDGTRDDAELAAKLAAASYTPPANMHASPLEAELHGRTFLFEQNYEDYRKVRFDFTGRSCTLALTVGDTNFNLVCGRENWNNTLYAAPVDYNVTPLTNLPIAAAFTWENKHSMLIMARDLHSAFVMTWKIVFSSNTLKMEHGVNATFGKTDIPTMNGKLVK